ncbi:FIST N-terminal domain-containing protein [Methanothermococcus okinawensis]|uniref:Transcriptional regulator, TrmB n=1 Tax=Methanothermococcus okinawensis (strain DSM 14208 / JCM 11175 / IH1) TaxID=647113 RepID=F8AKQ9_METOI|nr:FIST N-terminal domain-containing protein [Methanothermococcus okinawensis]AEH06397.1 transcriptional regulator, TrmB [Methanothermococcus okinawensis IH1]
MYSIHKEIRVPFKDGMEIARELKSKIKNPSLTILLTSIADKEDIEELINGLKTQMDVSNLIGCTTAGEFSKKGYINQNGVLLIAFDETCKVAIGHKKVEGNPINVGTSLAEDIKEKLKIKYPKINIDEKFLGFVFHDWNADNEDGIINGLAERLSFPIIGGTAGDNLKFNRTYQIYQDKVLSGHVLLGVISHRKRFEILYGHGYEPTECYARITKAKGKKIYELDGKPAYKVYREMISKISGIPEEHLIKYTPHDFKNLDFTILYPLGVQDAYGNYRILFLNNVDNDYLEFKHGVNEGAFLILMKTTPEKTINSLHQEISKLKNFKKPFIFIAECICREFIKNPQYSSELVSKDFKKLFINNKSYNSNNKNIINNCIGFLSYGESIVKDILRFHNTLTFVGVAFDLEGDEDNINWKKALRYFEFSEDEVSIISELINSRLSARELLNRLDISQTKLYGTLNHLEEKGIIKSDGKKPKTYYIGNIKEILEKKHIELESQHRFKKEKREYILSML